MAPQSGFNEDPCVHAEQPEQHDAGDACLLVRRKRSDKSDECANESTEEEEAAASPASGCDPRPQLLREPSIVSFEQAPQFLQFNEYIKDGYRTNLCLITCIKSLFWWTNETLNAWTHLLGWIYFAYYTAAELGVIGAKSADSSQWHDNIMMIVILVCFQVCMAMSTGYHTFACHSKNSYHCWLSYDLCGISFSIMAIYTSGIYYAFWCQNAVRIVYMGISGAMFLIALVLQMSPKYVTDDYCRARLVFFLSWTAFGILPCIHWSLQNGGFSNEFVLDLIGRIAIMYLICAAALFFYVTRIPEIFLPGWVDYIGSSHQWWHIIIFLAFYHWQKTGQYYAEFRARHGCFEIHSAGLNSTAW